MISDGRTGDRVFFDSTRRRSALALVGVLLMALGTLFTEPSGAPPITDLGRNMVAMQARFEGAEIVYAQLGDLDPLLGSDVSEWWVAQSPVAVASAFAPAYLGEVSSDRYRPVALAFLLAAGALYAVVLPRHRRWLVPWLLGATLVSAGWHSELAWINGQSFTAFGVAALVLAAQKGRADTASLVLGLLIAWRPWLLPLVAYGVPSDGLKRRLVVSGGVGALATLIAALFLGGLSSLGDFLVANASNMAQYRAIEWNLSLTSRLPITMSYGILVTGAVAVLVLVQRGFRQRSSLLAVVVIACFSPVVWSHYWLALVFLPFAVDGLDDYFSPAFAVGVLLSLSGFATGPSANFALYVAVAAIILYMGLRPPLQVLKAGYA